MLVMPASPVGSADVAHDFVFLKNVNGRQLLL
jgi:hypothetical protein